MGGTELANRVWSGDRLGRHSRRCANSDYDTECSFDVAQIQHDVPALRVQPFKRAFHVYESQYSIVSKL